MTVWAMTVSIVRVRLSRVLKRMMLGVGVMMEEVGGERVQRQWAREQQFDWEYCCWLAQQKEQEQEQEQCRHKKGRGGTERLTHGGC